MSVYRDRGTRVWRMDFVFRSQRIRETTGTTSKTLALEIQRKRRRGLEEGSAGIRKRNQPRLVSVAAASWLEGKKSTLAPSTITGYGVDLSHLLPELGKYLVCDLQPRDISDYQKKRLEQKASPKTVNNEVGVLRSVLRRNGAWANLQQDVTMMTANDDIGRAISADEEGALLKACGKSRSRSLLTFVVVAIETGARFNVVRTLQWKNVDFANRSLKFGKDKTAAGSGRIIPLNPRAAATLVFWATNFPDRQPDHFVFATERYGLYGEEGRKAGCAVPYSVNPAKPMGSYKTSWNAARKEAKVSCRFHDLRHTAVSRMLDAGVPMAKVAKIVGWSPATMVRMSHRYGHFNLEELRSAVESISRGGIAQGSPVIPPVSEDNGTSRSAKPLAN